MIADNTYIDKVIKILEKEVKKFENPVVENITNKYKSPFHILISTLLSARTKDEITEKVSHKLFKNINSPHDLIKMNETEIERLIYPIGFYKTKARNLKKLAQILIRDYKSKVPDDVNKLLKLPGVGRKTANLVIIKAFNKYGICVDTHVHRIVNRWGYVKTKNPIETEMALKERLPKGYWKIINRLLVIYGKNICRPIKPKCNICKIREYCGYNIS